MSKFEKIIIIIESTWSCSQCHCFGKVYRVDWHLLGILKSKFLRNGLKNLQAYLDYKLCWSSHAIWWTILRKWIYNCQACYLGYVGWIHRLHLSVYIPSSWVAKNKSLGMMMPLLARMGSSLHIFGIPRPSPSLQMVP